MLTRVTITGADDKVNPKELADLSIEFPFVEWGVLQSYTRSGKPRYPSFGWVKRLMDCTDTHPDMQLALHLCGSCAEDTIDGDSRCLEGRGDFKRVQLNGVVPTLALANIAVRASGVEFILQAKNALELVDYSFFATLLPLASVLFDVSGGRGVSPESWLIAPRGSRVGYAGGINPDNVIPILTQLTETRTTDFWIDMESGVRSGDEFDLVKVNAVLTQAAAFVKRGA